MREMLRSMLGLSPLSFPGASSAIVWLPIELNLQYPHNLFPVSLMMPDANRDFVIGPHDLLLEGDYAGKDQSVAEL